MNPTHRILGEVSFTSRAGATAMDAIVTTRHNWDVRRKAMWVALGIACAAYLPLAVWALAISDWADPATWAWLVAVVPGMIAAGVLMAVKRPENPIGEIAVWAALAMFLIPALPEIPTTIIYSESGTQPWMWFGMWLAMTTGFVGFYLIMALVALLPNGRIRHPRERRFLQVAAIPAVIPTLSLFTNEFVFTHQESFIGVDEVASPFFVPSLAGVGPSIAGLTAISYGLLLWAVALQFLRYRQGSAQERKQVRWVLFGGVTAMVLGVIPNLLDVLGIIDPIVHGSLASFLIVPVFFLFMGSVVISVLEPSWIDVDFVIRKSFVYGALSFVILMLYVAAASAFGVAAGSRLEIEIAVVLTVVIALLFQPARHRLQAVADRWVFGIRPSKYETVAEFGETIEQSSDPSELIPRLVTTIQTALSLKWVEAWLDDGTRSNAGDRSGAAVDFEVDIRAGEEIFGSIECGPKAEGSLDEGERQLVRTLAGQVGLAVMNARLAGRIVTAAESERRRIERNIHDGAQQELVALVARLGMARSAASRGALSANELDELQEEARRILSDLRELAQGIHPSVLSDGGILEAVEERCAHLPIDVTIDAPETLRETRFDDEIEGAAYFFIAESLANVLKHSDASSAVVSLDSNEQQIHLSVVDDGRGFDPTTSSLNGIAGLRDRVQALGGVLKVESRPGGGTLVDAVLPTE